MYLRKNFSATDLNRTDTCVLVFLNAKKCIKIVRDTRQFISFLNQLFTLISNVYEVFL